MRSSDRQTNPLTRQEALHKLGSVAVGRVLFARRWLPAVRFVNHILDDGKVIIHGNAADIAAPGTGEHTFGIAYQTDQIDPATRTGWSVTITGPATLITDPRKANRYRKALRPWVPGEMNDIISIDPQWVTGYEITAADPAEVPLPRQPHSPSRPEV